MFLPLVGVTRELLDQLSEALAKGPVDGALLQTLLVEEFYKTPLARPMAPWLVENALRSLLPEKVGASEFDAWKAVLLHALTVAPERCEVECMRLRPRLSAGIASSSPLLRALRDALYRPAEVSRSAWKHQLSAERAVHPGVDCRSVARRQPGVPRMDDDGLRRVLHAICPTASDRLLLKGVEHIRRLESRDAGLIDLRVALPVLFDEMSDAKVAEAFRRLESVAGPGGWSLPITPSPLGDWPPGHLLAYVAKKASVDHESSLSPVGRYDTVGNALTSLLYGPGGLAGARDLLTSGVAAVRSAWDAPDRPCVQDIHDGGERLPRESERSRFGAGALTPYGAFTQMPALAGGFLEGLPGAHAGEADDHAEAGLLSPPEHALEQAPSTWWSPYVPVLGEIGAALLRHPKAMVTAVAGLGFVELVRRSRASDDVGGQSLAAVDGRIIEILGDRWDEIRALALMSNPPANVTDRVLAAMDGLTDEVRSAIGRLADDVAVPTMDLFVFDAPLNDLNLAMWVIAMAFREPGPGLDIDIPHDNFTLPNGLQVIVHEDRKAPVIAVQVWYKVGSAHEPPGSTGLAHLFEHMFFLGSKNHPGEYTWPFIEVGAEPDGMTQQDATVYRQTVPSTALEMALWMESDRMGQLLPVDQQKLDNERGVVRNEKLEGDTPMSRAGTKLSQAMYPEGHPYRHDVIGSMEDLDAVTPARANQWLRTWYGPNNAVVVLAGDIDLAMAREQVSRHFGDIVPGPVHDRMQPDVARRVHSTREIMIDRFARPTLYRAWNIPQANDPAFICLDLFARVLTDRLQDRLTGGEIRADYATASTAARALGSQFGIGVGVASGTDMGPVEAAISEQIDLLVAEGPTEDELALVRTRLETDLVNTYEGVAGKASALGRCAAASGTSTCFRDGLERVRDASAQAVRDAGRDWLTSGDHTLLLVPGERLSPSVSSPAIPAAVSQPVVSLGPSMTPIYDRNLTATQSGVDRSAGVPMPSHFPAMRFPVLQRGRLANDMNWVLAERHGTPMMRMRWEFRGGHANDAAGSNGVSRFTMALLTEGAGNLDAKVLRDRLDSLGADIGAQSTLDGCSVDMTVMKSHLDPAMKLLADVLLRPRFDPAQIEKTRRGLLGSLAHDSASPDGAVSRLLPGLVYGQEHPYASPSGGWGTETSLAAIAREDIVAFHRDWLRPENATLIVVGDTTPEAVTSLLETHLGSWQIDGEAPSPVELPPVAPPRNPVVYLVDHPDGSQVTITAALVLVPDVLDTLDFGIANAILGEGFGSRVNKALRTDRGWSYGGGSSVRQSRGPGLWELSMGVQADKASEALSVLQGLISDYATGVTPATGAEVQTIKASWLRSLPKEYEKGSAVLDAVSHDVRLGHPDDYMQTYQSQLEQVTVDSVNAAARALNPNAFTWMVVGDLSRIESSVRELRIGETKVLDNEGRVVSEVVQAPGGV
jgi:zinc protease